MIPILYKLREGIRFQDRDAVSLVISEVPLNVVRASKRAVRILLLCDGKRTLQQIADDVGIAEEAQVFNICEYFNKRAVLETRVAQNPGYFPSISVIVPTRDRCEDLVECLDSLYSQDYPPDGFDVIVVDDGSLDETRELAGSFPCKLVTNPVSRGQSYCRNAGARQARGEILAFMDDDCVAGRTWLRDLAAYFRWEDLGAVGGYVDGYRNRTPLDRYEREFSRLNLGNYILHAAKDPSTFFIPTCSMLVRKEVFMETGAIRETMRLGEDVDFCWRMRDAGWQALYVPAGTVKHKHRNTLWSMPRRRMDYGTSEENLYSLHPHKAKTLQIRPLAAAAFLGLCAAVVLLNPFPLVVTGGSFLADMAAKTYRLRRKRIRVSFGKVGFSVLRMHASCFYAISFHLARYYLVVCILLGFAFHPLWGLGFCFLMLAAFVDYSVKRPRLAFPGFLFYYFLDHLSYQLGVLAGCLRARSFRSFRLRLIRRSGDIKFRRQSPKLN